MFLILISIPSGAIKRKFEKNTRKHTRHISIPSGAIKRFFLLRPKFHSILFQFLLVRLRGGRQATAPPLTLISIPSGAIKSLMKL